MIRAMIRQLAALALALSPAFAALGQAPAWELEQIAASRIAHPAPRMASGRPVHGAEPMNLFVVIETGDHHATILDGDRLEPVARFSTREAQHGGPKFSPGGRFAYFVSRDGWISKYDLHNLRMAAEVRAGIDTRNAAVSSDGRYVMVANYVPHTLVVLDARDLAPLKVIPVRGVNGRSSRVSAVYDAAPRGSFIAALKDVKEIWEIPYGANAEPVYKGLVHDYKMKEGIAETGPFPVRQIQLDDYVDDFFFDRRHANVVGAAHGAKNGQVVNLHVGRRIETIELGGRPHLGSGAAWVWQGRTVLAAPNLEESQVSVIDTTTWRTIRKIPTLGAGCFLRSHEGTPYAWVDASNNGHGDAVQVIDKPTLEVVRTLRPAPGRAVVHVEFSADGRYAVVSVGDVEGEIIVYDASTLEVVRRLPMNKPSGTYNVRNGVAHSDATGQ